MADSLSMLSTPTPALPMTLSFLAADNTSGVTLVCERTMRPSYSPMIEMSSSGLSPVLKSALRAG